MFTLRAATPKDVDILASIEAQSFPEAEMATRESFEKRLAVFPDCFLILFEDGEPVGLHRLLTAFLVPKLFRRRCFYDLRQPIRLQ